MIQKGDMVVIATTSKFYDTSKSNPPNSITGVVKKVYSDKKLPIRVKWDNGIKNSYTEKDLVTVNRLSNEALQDIRDRIDRVGVPPEYVKWFIDLYKEIRDEKS